MELTPTQISALQNLTVSSGKVNTESLSVGQQLLAKVVAINNATGDVTLNINNALLNTKSSIPLTAGQTLQLIVAQLGKELVLQLPQALIEQAITQKTLRESLPNQQSQTETLRNLQHLVEQGKKSGISNKIIQFTQKFIQQLPGSSQLSQAQSLKEVIQRSGIFLENKFANIQSKGGQGNISNDFKSFLLQLKSLLVNERNDTIKQTTTPTPDKTTANNPQLATNESKILDLAKQIKTEQAKTSEEGKLATNARHTQQTQSTSQQVKDALQQALAKINQQQKSISQNLSRLLSTANIRGGATPTGITTAPAAPLTNPSNPNIAKPASIALNDALAFASNTQKTNQPEINFSRLNNLADLLDTLIKQVDAGISRTQLHQLNSLLEPEGGKLGWSMEIPVKIDDKLHSIHLHLEKEPGTDEDAEPVLTVNIALDLEKLGPVYARITLIAENVGVALWAEHEETYQLTQLHVDDLHNNLHKSGLKPENIIFHHGQPPQKSVLNKTQTHALLDVKV